MTKKEKVHSQKTQTPAKRLDHFLVKPRKPGTTFNHQLKMYGTTVTQQSHKDACDINLIMARFVKTGVLEHMREHGPEYGFASSDTFRDSLEIISKANSMFESLPSQIRNRFENDPGQFLDFVQDPGNIDEMREMGLASKNSEQNSETPEPSTQIEGAVGVGESHDTPQESSDAQASVGAVTHTQTSN